MVEINFGLCKARNSSQLTLPFHSAVKLKDDFIPNKNDKKNTVLGHANYHEIKIMNHVALI